jgi:large subunit ribosomal protein L4
MKTEIYNIDNAKVGEMELPDRIFGVKWNPDLVNQALSAQNANSRQTIAHAKSRSEVRGGGKKPWRQKGTGRARHGSTRSPIWVGGGVSFGPDKERIFSKKINKKMKRLAIFSVLSRKAKDGELRVVDSFKMESQKTSDFAKAIKNLVDLRSKNLFIASKESGAISRPAANIKKIRSIGSRSVNVRDLLDNKKIFLEKEAVAEIDNNFK